MQLVVKEQKKDRRCCYERTRKEIQVSGEKAA